MAKICEEIVKFRKYLDEKGIIWHDKSEDFSISEDYEMWICRTHFEYNGVFYSVINGVATYGGWSLISATSGPNDNQGLLEIMSGSINGGEPVGWQTSEECIKLVFEGE